MRTSSQNLTLLVVDDLQYVREFYRDVAETGGWTVIEAHDAESFNNVIAQPYDAILLDLAMPSMTGIEALEHLAASSNKAMVVIASGQDIAFLDMSMKMGRDLGLDMITRLQKPIDLKKLEHILDLLAKRVERDRAA